MVLEKLHKNVIAGVGTVSVLAAAIIGMFTYFAKAEDIPQLRKERAKEITVIHATYGEALKRLEIRQITELIFELKRRIKDADEEELEELEEELELAYNDLCMIAPQHRWCT